MEDMGDDDHLTQHARALFQALQSSGTSSMYGPTKGHPVDSLAKWACTATAPAAQDAQLPFAKAARLGQLEWWWLLLESVRAPASWPVHQGTQMSDGAQPPTLAESRRWPVLLLWLYA